MVEVNQKPITITAVKGENSDGAFEVTFLWEEETVTLAEWIEAYGKIPLPPYIKRAAQNEDEQRYQTIFAQHNGSVAAPTAGLHFTEEVFRSLKEKKIENLWVTLHVGAGTFKPVSTETIGEHLMHKEQIVITRETIETISNCNNKKIIAVGTTVARTLESLFIIGAKLYLNLPDPFNVQQWEIYENEELRKVDATTSLKMIYNYLIDNDLHFLTASTALMITPGYEHKIAKGLITNFHQPQSTLLLLIASYLGDKWKEIYQHALTHNYRFLSYGDSNLYL
jgi:S-adenosylmethionine:tRNA ribosyltransferase-isomerase